MNEKIITLSGFMVILLSAVSFVLFPMNIAKSADIKSTGKIIVEITGLKSNDGTVIVGLYNNANGYPGTPEKNSIIKSAKGTITYNKSIVEINDVPYGVYAISGFHDENNNENVDVGNYGIPKEGFFYSNNAKAKYGPPAFDDAKFELKSSDVKQTLEIIYFNY